MWRQLERPASDLKLQRRHALHIAWQGIDAIVDMACSRQELGMQVAGQCNRNNDLGCTYVLEIHKHTLSQYLFLSPECHFLSSMLESAVSFVFYLCRQWRERVP